MDTRNDPDRHGTGAGEGAGADPWSVAPVGILEVDAGGTVVGANAAAARLLVGAGAEVTGVPLAELVDPVDAGTVQEALDDAAHDGAPEALRLPAPSTTRDLLWRIVPVGTPGGGAIVTVEDITGLVQADPTVVAMRAALDAWPGFVGITDDRANVVFLNTRARELLGRRGDTDPGTLRTTDLFDASTFARYYDEIRPVLLSGAQWSGVVRLAGGASTGTEVRMVLVAGVGPGRTVDWLVAMSGAEAEPSSQDDLAFRATHDDLTGLVNRALFLDRLRLSLLRRGRSHHPVTVVFMDLDGFKGVNDDAGHLVGDEVLRQVGERIRASVRPADTAARWGGDEFVVLCEDPVDATALARRLAAAVSDRPFSVEGRDLRLGASVGIATSPPGPSGAEELVAAADAEMYRAKRGR